MNLLHHLLLRIIAVALLCLLAITAYVLTGSHQAAEQATRGIADALGKQLGFQQLQMNAGYGDAAPFPNFTLWKQTHSAPGICIGFIATDNGQSYHLCNGADFPAISAPRRFETVYRWFFQPGLALTQEIRFKGRDYGVLTITPSAEMEINQAWGNIRHLLGLSVVTVFAVCGLVYLGIRRALRPTRIIVGGLKHLEQGRLAYRLPSFELVEWQQISEAINKLASSQQQLLDERQRLAVQLLNLQEEERRYLARELHDEFGQCLAAINAVTASLAQTAAAKCPELLAETGHISQITEHMLNGVKSLLTRLRPAGLDELGLTAHLEALIAGWNAHGNGKTYYRFNKIGDCSALSETLAVTLFRISQECLTNIAKHAAASLAEVRLTISPETVKLTIEDNGVAIQLPFPAHPGLGLIGMRERATALHGRLTLSLVRPQGLKVEVCLPIHAPAEAAE
jgi:two-component system sensor histidine kinase UhpB